MSVADVRARAASAPALPYYRFGSRWTDDAAIRRADTALEHGWYRESDHTTVPLEFPWVWDNETWSDQTAAETHSWEALDPLLQAHSSSGDWHYLSRAIDLVNDWLAHGSDTAAAWLPATAGRRAHRLAYVLSAAARDSGVGDVDVDTLRAAAASHHERLESAITDFEVAAGLASIEARCGGLDPALMNGAVDALAVATVELTGRLGIAASPQAHLGALDALGALLDAGLVDDARLATARRRHEAGVARLVAPDGSLAGFGTANLSYVSDVWTARPSPLPAIATSHQSPELLHAASAGRYGEPTPSGLHVDRESGIVTIRDTEPSLLVLLLAGSGVHDDALSITWADRGRSILIDAGGYASRPGEPESEERRRLVASAAAHNAIALDEGAGTSDAAVERWGNIKGATFVDASAQRRGAHHRRSLVYQPGSWLLVGDTITADGPVIARQLFLAAPDLTASEWKRSVMLSHQGVPAVFATQATDAEPLGTRTGIDEPALAGWWAPSPDHLAPAPSFGWEPRASSPTLITVFTFEPVQKVSWDGSTCSWTTKSERIAVTLAEWGVVNVTTGARNDD